MGTTKIEWTDLNLPFGPLLDDDAEQEDSLVRRQLNKPGILIETEFGTHLIGEMNERGGVCDCCQAFSRKTVVKRYAIVWEP